ncbi:alpha-hydroxy-acid oxidizing protein [Parasedimentitalea marina]|uniref:Alpha-hydroxy-acid oxidizing protein n=1 Tax=Parasedimentitalea marina TaxID=2483033 RepID=A0A3T0N0E8_9RHOB|nr:alpha-hydroxy acid oxidase [Parasedimentitalea marina]AZV77500.1 alpha-hydroxy-acid oxidizing protein [Parasedimentitalea marina]
MDLHSRYPAIADLARQAQRRLPPFVWEYLDSATGTEATKTRNRAALDRVGFLPSILHGPLEVDLSTTLFGEKLPLPFGVAPVGMSGLIWPDAEGHLARSAAAAGIPYTLSTVASQSPEDLAPHLGEQAWFQLYPPKDPDIRIDMLARAKSAGFKVLVLTVDVPVASRRERQMRSGLTQPPRLTPRLLAQTLANPTWALGMARRGMPHMRTLDKYITGNLGNLSSTAHIGYLLRTSPDWEYVQWLRDHWQGPIVIKGVMRPEDAERLQDMGVDALWVSNHGGRQFDASPATIEMLPEIRRATTLPLIFDSGVEGGLDMLRALALGADYIMLGRAFHFALAALGEPGPAHLIDILKQDLKSNMGQIGATDVTSLPLTRTLGPAHQLPI